MSYNHTTTEPDSAVGAPEPSALYERGQVLNVMGEDWRVVSDPTPGQPVQTCEHMGARPQHCA